MCCKKNKKILAICKTMLYNTKCCGMIALKREVAAFGRFFRGANVKLRKLATSHCTIKMADLSKHKNKLRSWQRGLLLR